MDIQRRLENHYRRWNISFDEEEQFWQLKNRVRSVLKSYVRLYGAFIGSINISTNKSYAAIAFQTETKDLAPLAQSRQELFGLYGAAAF